MPKAYTKEKNCPRKEVLRGKVYICEVLEIKEFNDLKRVILKTPVGEKVDVHIIRKGKTKTINVEIEEMPK